jgi:hypothetical protein
MKVFFKTLWPQQTHRILFAVRVGLTDTIWAVNQGFRTEKPAWHGHCDRPPREGQEMKLLKLKETFGGLILGISLLLGIGMMASSTAQAQYQRYPTWEQERQRQREIERLRRQQERQRMRNNDWWNRQNQGYGTYDNYPNYGGSFEFRQTALNAGYNEGMKAGRDDRRRGERYEFRDEGAFQSASKDYNSRMGDRRTYAAYFRQAFETGYRDGYQGY